MKITPELLQKYYADKSTSEEQKAVEEWQSNSEANFEYPSDEKLEIIENVVWNTISEEIVNKTNQIGTSPLSRKKQFFTHKTKKILIAASIALLIGLGSLQTFFTPNTIIYKTIVGEMKIVTLQDGTMVYLNANSVLETPEEFTKKTRSVSLIGEAYFEVTKDSLRPFLIDTEKSQTKVLGTKFNLSAYPKENTILTLNEGKVSFKKRDGSENALIILPNEQVLLANNQLQKKDVNAKHYKSWIRNDLFFDDTMISVFKDIERKYNVNIIINNNEILSKEYRGYHQNLSLETLLEELSFVMNFNYKINKRTITIH
tara:strand:+ start:38939 stop:39883 length:945 start_codon:yes stop_codon:yes gene_type:complete